MSGSPWDRLRRPWSRWPWFLPALLRRAHPESRAGRCERSHWVRCLRPGPRQGFSPKARSGPRFAGSRPTRRAACFFPAGLRPAARRTILAAVPTRRRHSIAVTSPRGRASRSRRRRRAAPPGWTVVRTTASAAWPIPVRVFQAVSSARPHHRSIGRPSASQPSRPPSRKATGTPCSASLPARSFVLSPERQ
jgi:hypothetical protein